MFTGIITHLGKVHANTGARISIDAPKDFLSGLKIGDSVSVSGTCLTVVELTEDRFSSDCIPETLAKTNLASLKQGSVVNLEKAADSSTKLDGHVVQGHIDGTGKIESMESDGNSHILRISIPPDFSKMIVSKGSIAVNGISLTIIESGKDSFTVGIIPHTWEQTNLSELKIGATVNIELDILAKYAQKLLK